MKIPTRILNGIYRLWGWLPIPFWLRALILRAGNNQFVVGVGAVILDEQGRVLFFRHTYRPEMPWGMPGGWLKYGEDPAQAVAREVLEESGMRIEVYEPLRMRRLDFTGGLDLVYLARYVGGTFRSSPEVCQAEFFTYPDFPPVYPSTREVIEMVVKREAAT